jgi:hypothetical protein
MKSQLTLLLAIAILIGFSSLTFAQDRPVWMLTIENELDTGEWQTIRKRTYLWEKSQKFHSSTIQTVHKREYNATVDISLKSSVGEAKNTFKSFLPPRKSKQNNSVLRTIAGLGDESQVSTLTGWEEIRFRKGRVYVVILGSTEDTARAMAKLVADHIPDKN